MYSCKLDFRNNCNRQAPTKVITAEIANKLLVDGYLIRPKNVVAEMHLKHGIGILYNKAWKAKEYAESVVIIPSCLLGRMWFLNSKYKW